VMWWISIPLINDLVEIADKIEAIPW